MIDSLGSCPLCGSPDGDVLLEVAYDDVWKRFAQDWGVELSPEVRTGSADGNVSTLVRCASCELERFEPLAPGGPDFYRELMHATPYAEDRWDFAAARRAIVPQDDVLDLGCGTGRFLASLGERTGRRVGVDHNANAVAAIVARGGEAYAGSFQDFARTEPSRFDVVTSFHTMEHVADPLGMIRGAGTCLRPNGRLLLSVPNRERTWRDEGEPMDRPPHHVTRWGPQQMDRLATLAGFDLERVSYESPGVRQAHASSRAAIDRRLAPWPTPLRRVIGELGGAASAAQAWRYRRVESDHFARRGLYGHSMLAVLRHRGDRTAASSSG